MLRVPFLRKKEPGVLLLEKKFLSSLSLPHPKEVLFEKGEIVPGFFQCQDLKDSFSSLGSFSSPLIVLVPDVYLKVFLFCLSLEPIPKSQALSAKEAKEKKKEILKRANSLVLEELNKIGILPKDFKIISGEVLWQTADGYRMASLEGLWGKKLEVGVKMVGVFRNNLEVLQTCLGQALSLTFKLAHPLEVLFCVSDEHHTVLFLAHENYWVLEKDENGLERKVFSQEWGTENIYLRFAKELGWSRKETEHYLLEFQKEKLSESLQNKMREVIKDELESSGITSFLPAHFLWYGDKVVLEVCQKMGYFGEELSLFKNNIPSLCLWDSLKREGR